MPQTVPFAERSRDVQLTLAVFAPFIFGCIVGIVLGISAAGYWILSLIAALLTIVAGLEHPGPRPAAVRGVIMGAIYGVAVLLAHEVAGTDAKASLGSFPPAVIIIDAIAGSILAAIGGALARSRAARSS
jgi:ABC-type antimicrobial peptide transport system permease subunit